MVDIHDIDDNAPWRNDPIAKGLALAVRKWNIHNRKGKEEIKPQQEAVIEYGQWLLKGRNKYPSNKAFKKWVLEWDLSSSYPFNNPRERSEAMRIAEIVFRTSTEDTECFSKCEHTVPSNMMKWARKTGLVSIKRRNPEPTLKAREQIRIVVKNGEPVKRDDISQATGLSDGAVGRAHAMEQARLEGIAEGEANILNAQGKFTKVQARHVNALVNKLERHLHKTFNEAVETRVAERVAERKASLDKAREACDEQKQKAFAEQQRWKKLINGHKPPLLQEEWITPIKCVHPDSWDKVSSELRTEAFRILMSKKFILTGKE